MKKRIIAFICSFVVIVSCIVIPSFAFNQDEFDQTSLVNFSSYQSYFDVYGNRVYYMQLLNPDYSNLGSAAPDMAFSFPDKMPDTTGGFQAVLLRHTRTLVSFQQAGIYTDVLSSTTVRISTDDSDGDDMLEDGEPVKIVIELYEWGADTATHAYDLVYYFNDGFWVRSDTNSVVKDVSVGLYFHPYGVNGNSNYMGEYNPEALNLLNVKTVFPYFNVGYGQYEYNQGYEKGRIDGFTEGDQYGYDRGYEEGKFDGATEGTTGWMNFKNLIFTIFDAPFYILTTALDFELFGINIAGTLIGIISLALIVFILKIIIVRLF